jgi:hypothetical protein
MNRILRWTVGDTSDIGISILNESIKVAKKTLCHLNFEMIVCSNSNSDRVSKICHENKILLYEAKWADFPLPEQTIPFCDDLHARPGVPKGRQGSFWKLCPPRIDIDSHEIVCDNDILIQRCPEEIERFVQEDKTLICEDEIFSLGKYTKFLGKPYNSGLYGLPPKFDFSQMILNKWKESGSMEPLMSRDEQGLISLALTTHEFIIIPIRKICMAFEEGMPASVDYIKTKENGYETQRVSSIKFSDKPMNREILHFIGANRRESHKYWSQYKIKAM